MILIQRESPHEPYKSLSFRVPMYFTYLLNMTRGKDFINKSVKLSHDLICKILISHLFIIYVDKIILGRYVLCNYFYIYLVCICAI
jgi:hypothetical protein